MIAGGLQGRHEGGFTLVELLVAFVLLGLVMTLLYGGFSFANRIFDRSSSASAYMDDILQTQNQLRTLVGSAYPEEAEFLGGRERLEFLAPVTRYGAADGLYRIALYTANREGRSAFVMSLEPYETQGSGRGGAAETILLNDVRELRFSYFSSSPDRPQGGWLDIWEGRQGLPRLVKITLDTEKGLHNRWPALIIPFQITQNVDCRYDPVSRNCVSR